MFTGASFNSSISGVFQDKQIEVQLIGTCHCTMQAIINHYINIILLNKSKLCAYLFFMIGPLDPIFQHHHRHHCLLHESAHLWLILYLCNLASPSHLLWQILACTLFFRLSVEVCTCQYVSLWISSPFM